MSPVRLADHRAAFARERSAVAVEPPDDLLRVARVVAEIEDLHEVEVEVEFRALRAARAAARACPTPAAPAPAPLGTPRRASCPTTPATAARAARTARHTSAPRSPASGRSARPSRSSPSGRRETVPRPHAPPCAAGGGSRSRGARGRRRPARPPAAARHGGRARRPAWRPARPRCRRAFHRLARGDLRARVSLDHRPSIESTLQRFEPRFPPDRCQGAYGWRSMPRRSAG